MLRKLLSSPTAKLATVATLTLFACAPAKDELASPQKDDGSVGMHVAHRDDRFGVPTFIWLDGKTAPAPGVTARQTAWQVLRQLAPTYHLSTAALDATELRTLHDTGRGAIIAHFEQHVGDTGVFLMNLNIALSRTLDPVAASGYLAPRVTQADATYHIDEQAAIAAATQAMTSRDTTQVQSLRAIAASPARAKRTLYARPDGLTPSYYIELDLQRENGNDSELRAYVISALDGNVLFEKDLTAADSYAYRVWADKDNGFTPWDGPQGTALSPHPTGMRDGTMLSYLPAQLVTLPNLPFSRNDPWLPNGATEARGNNALAYADIVAPDGLSAGDVMLTTSGPNSFDYPLDVSTQDPAGSPTAMKAVTTNFFYTVNYLHDLFYDAGWDEGSYNPQQDNYGRGGIGGDPIRAEAQDSSGRNNANASTPADGTSPRIQMYLWDPTRQLHVNQPAPLAGDREISNASFGPKLFDVTQDVVLVDDGTGTPSDGCETPFRNAAALAGKIALIDRSSCAYHIVTYNAQLNGAVGVVFANNVAGAPVSMRASTPPPPMPVTIPAMMIQKTEGDAIKMSLASGTAVNLSLQALFANNDSSLDLTIIAHEWGHVLSNRLIGNSSGLGNTQGSGMGEGWSDFVALLAIIRPEDATMPANANWTGVYPVSVYAAGPGDNAAYDGIRRYPYSADMNKAPLTYKHIANGTPLPTTPAPTYGQDGSNNAEVHATGEVWTNLLFECYVALLRDTKRYTFAQAQRAMRDYLVASFKLTPMSPTILEARDALLAAAYANSAEDYDLFVRAFAKRGAGIGAVGPDKRSNDNKGVSESFKAGADFNVVEVKLSDDVHSCDHDGVLDNDEVGRLSITLRNTGSVPLQASAMLASNNPAVSDGSAGPIVFPTANPYKTTTASVNLSMKGAPLGQSFEVTLLIDAQNKAVPGTVTYKRTFFGNYDVAYGTSANDAMDDANPVWNVASDAKLDTSTPWQHAPDKGYWSIPDDASPSDNYLISPPLQVDSAGSFGFTLRHRFSYEADMTNKYDGSVIELSDDNGMTWKDIDAQLIGNGYNGTLWSQNQPLANRRAFTGASTGYPAFIETQADFATAYQGKTVLLRFRVGTDPAAGGPGWDLDELRVSGIKNTPFSTRTLTHTDCKNRPPQVMAPAEITVEPGEHVTLNATASDPDGDVLTVRYTQQSGPMVMLSDAQILTPNFTAPQVTEPTTLTFAAVVNDGTVDSAPAIIRVNVATTTHRDPPNTPMGKVGGCSITGTGARSASSGFGILVALLGVVALFRRRLSLLLLIAGGCSNAQMDEVPFIPYRPEVAPHGSPSRLTVGKSGDGTGSVMTEPGSSPDGMFPYDAVVTVRAKPDANSIFAGWSGDCHGADFECKVRMNIDRTVSARFEARLCSADGLCWERPFPQGNALYAVQVLDADHVIAAGAGGLILYKEGTRWSRPASGTTHTLRGLYAAARDNVFAVGEAGSISHFDGTSFTAQTSGVSVDLYAVWGSAKNDVWAAGDGGTLLHYDGTAWTPRPIGAAADESLRGVHGSAADNVWVVSTSGNVFHFDGTAFTKTALAQRRLLAVWVGAPNSAWAVGDNGAAYQFDGSMWTSKPVSTSASLTAVYGPAADQIVVASSASMMQRRDGTSWRAIDNVVGTALYAAHGSGSDVWLVGGRGAVVRWNGSALLAQSSGTETRGVSAAWASSANSVWLVGAAGFSARVEGAQPVSQPTGVSADLLAISGSDESNIWAVGELGTALHRSGNAAWQITSTGTPQALYAVWTRGAKDTWAVGEMGTVLHHDGATWQFVNTGAQADLYAVWSSGPMDVWVGGARELLHFDGQSWKSMPLPNAPIYALAGRVRNDVWAAGSVGALHHFDGSSWQSARALTAGISANLRAIALTGSDGLWIAAEQGVVLRGTSSQTSALTVLASDTSANLYGIAAPDPRHVWLVGAAGVLSYRR